MDDRQTFAALCAQPRSIFSPVNSSNTLCCNDVLDLIRIRVCPPQVWAIDCMGQRAAFYDLGTHAWSRTAPLHLQCIFSAAQVPGRGWLVTGAQSLHARSLGEYLLFIDPRKAPAAVVPYKGTLGSSVLTYVSDCVVSLHSNYQYCSSQVTAANLDEPKKRSGDFNTIELANVHHAVPMVAVPCGRGALLGWRINYTPSFRCVNIDSLQVLEPAADCPIKCYDYCIRALSVSAGVEFWDNRGPVALYDLRDRIWQSHAHVTRDQSPRFAQSVVSIDCNLVACLTHDSSQLGSVLKLYDRRAMAFVPSSDSASIAMTFDSLICL